MEAAPESLKLELQQFGVRSPGEFESTFAAMSKERVEAVAIMEDTMIIANAAAVVSLAARHRILSIGFVEIAEAGGLMAYGVNIPAMYRRAAVFVDKILKGAKPGDLPIEQATTFELVINLQDRESAGHHDSAIAPAARGQGDRVNTRRHLLVALGGTALAWAGAARAQAPAKVRRIGLLSPYSPSDAAPWHQAFRLGLRDLGWVEGKNISIEYRYAEGKTRSPP